MREYEDYSVLGKKIMCPRMVFNTFLRKKKKNGHNLIMFHRIFFGRAAYDFMLMYYDGLIYIILMCEKF